MEERLSGIVDPGAENELSQQDLTMGRTKMGGTWDFPRGGEGETVGLRWGSSSQGGRGETIAVWDSQGKDTNGEER